MHLIWIFAISIYLVFNLIIMIAWFDGREYESKGEDLIATLLLVLFGLPILLIVFIVATVVYIVKGEE